MILALLLEESREGLSINTRYDKVHKCYVFEFDYPKATKDPWHPNHFRHRVNINLSDIEKVEKKDREKCVATRLRNEIDKLRAVVNLFD